MAVVNGNLPGTETPMFTEDQKTEFILDFAANEYLRHSPLLMMLAYAVDLTEPEVDEMFRLAATL
jgi:hypothetical protein